MRRLAINTALVCATLTGVVLLFRLRYVLGLLAFAIVLAAALRPLIAVLRRAGLPRVVALALTYLVVAAVPVGLVVLLFPTLATEFTAALDGFLPWYTRVGARLGAAGGALGVVAGWLPAASVLAGVVAHVRPAAVVGGAWYATRLLLEGAASGVLVVVLSISWSASGALVVSGLAALIPAHRRPLFRRLAEDLGIGVGRHVLGEAGKSLLALGTVALGLSLLSAPAVVLPAVLVAILRLVPIVGLGLSIVAVAVAALPLGLVAGGLAAAAAWALLVGLHAAVPRVLGMREYNPLLGAFVALVLATAVGWAGLLLAPAVAAAIQIAIESVFRAHQDPAAVMVTGADVFAGFQRLVADVAADRRASRRARGLVDNLGRLLTDLAHASPDPLPLPPPPAPPRDQSSVLFGASPP